MLFLRQLAQKITLLIEFNFALQAQCCVLVCQKVKKILVVVTRLVFVPNIVLKIKYLRFIFQGGPLVCNGKLFGDVSVGYGCGLKNFPGVYGATSQVREWIRSICGV